MQLVRANCIIILGRLALKKYSLLQCLHMSHMNLYGILTKHCLSHTVMSFLIIIREVQTIKHIDQQSNYSYKNSEALGKQQVYLLCIYSKLHSNYILLDMHLLDNYGPIHTCSQRTFSSGSSFLCCWSSIKYKYRSRKDSVTLRLDLDKYKHLL